MDHPQPYASLIRIVRRLAVAISIVITGAVPAALGIHAYVDMVAHGQVAARVSAERIGQYAFVQGDMWRFSSHRIAELIGSSADALNSPRQYVEFADGSPIVDIGEPLPGPKVAGVWPIIVLGERVGAVRVEASLIPLFWKVGFLTLLGGLLGGFTYIVIEHMPLRALQRVTDDLQKTQSELSPPSTSGLPKRSKRCQTALPCSTTRIA